MVVASYAATAMLLSGNRFALGVGRGTDSLIDSAGIAKATNQLMEDYVDILRRFWRGESVTYDGPAGRFKNATMGAKLDVAPPIIMGAVGFKNCEWAGKFADGVLLNTFWTKEATAEGVRVIRGSAENAGRDPKRIRIWSILATACEVPEDVELRSIIRRLNTYLFFPRQWDATCNVNHWDRDVANRLITALKEIDGSTKGTTIGDEHTSRDLDDIRKMRDLWPAQWIAESTATGNAAHCAQCVLNRFEAGVDGVAFHATSPANLAPLLKEWPKFRPLGLEKRLVNPGL